MAKRPRPRPLIRSRSSSPGCRPTSPKHGAHDFVNNGNQKAETAMVHAQIQAGEQPRRSIIQAQNPPTTLPTIPTITQAPQLQRSPLRAKRSIFDLLNPGSAKVKAPINSNASPTWPVASPSIVPSALALKAQSSDRRYRTWRYPGVHPYGWNPAWLTSRSRATGK